MTTRAEYPPDTLLDKYPLEYLQGLLDAYRHEVNRLQSELDYARNRIGNIKAEIANRAKTITLDADQEAQ
jgi:hypothetical protein